jgi:hypothetical protein
MPNIVKFSKATILIHYSIISNLIHGQCPPTGFAQLNKGDLEHQTKFTHLNL